MSRSEIVLAAMAPGGTGAWFDPARIQQLLFLVHVEVASRFSPRVFRFQVDEWGPVDPGIGSELHELSGRGLVEIDRTGEYAIYSLTGPGVATGLAALDGMSEAARRFIEDANLWVRTRTIRQVLLEIRTRYPDRAAAVSVGVTREMATPATPSPWRAFLRGMRRTLDFGRRLPNGEPTGRLADADAISADWIAVGQALEDALAAQGPPPPSMTTPDEPIEDQGASCAPHPSASAGLERRD